MSSRLHYGKMQTEKNDYTRNYFEWIIIKKQLLNSLSYHLDLENHTLLDLHNSSDDTKAKFNNYTGGGIRA